MLKDILRVPTVTRNETLLVEWLETYLAGQAGCEVYKDRAGNLLITKGQAASYPLVCAHLDTVHEPANVIIKEEGDRLFALDWTDHQTGCGGDDKCGVYICLEMLKRLPMLKVAFFVSEECGCVGSRRCVQSWFTDVSYAMEFDSPCDDIMTFTCDGTQLFPVEGPFFEAIYPQLHKFGVTKWQHHPYTDVSILKRHFDFPCLNLPAGYFRMHSRQEYVQVSVVENSLNLGFALVEALGTKAYKYLAPDHWSGDVETPVPVTFLHTHDYGFDHQPDYPSFE